MLKLMLFVILGAIIVLLLSLNAALAKPDFSTKAFLKANLLSTVINMLIGVVLIYAQYDMKVVLYPLTNMTALMLGTSAQVVFKKVTDIFNANEPTFFGINKQSNDTTTTN